MAKYLDFELDADDLRGLNKVKKMANRAAYDMLAELDRLYRESKWTTAHSICTSESLSAGMIMSTLVDIPWGGNHKYGGFAVYDTDAKRVFNKVAVDDVYTHRCAKEMAIGTLRNSNATIAISVTGNAMPNPTKDELNQLGEVFIGVAGYANDDITGLPKIIYSTTVMNACGETKAILPEFRNTCKEWHATIRRGLENGKTAYNPRNKTALISQAIRNYTTYKALTFCLDFVIKHKLIVPEFIAVRKSKNASKDVNGLHIDTPENKYDNLLPVEQVGVIQYDTVAGRRDSNTATYADASISRQSSVTGYIPPARVSSFSRDGVQPVLYLRNMFEKSATLKKSPPRSASLTKSKSKPKPKSKSKSRSASPKSSEA